MHTVVSNENWLALAAAGGKITSSRFGYTPTPMTTVWPSRTPVEHVLYFCTHGGFKVVFGNHVVTVNRGSFVWVMPGVEHATQLLDSRQPFRTYFLRFDLKGEDGSSTRLSENAVTHSDAWNLLPLLRDIVQELQSPQPFHEQRFRAMLMLLTTAAIRPRATPGRAVFSAQQRDRLRRHMERRATERVTPNELAEQLSLSPRYFRRIFLRSFGMSPMHWIVRQRILVAALMLAGTELQAKDVAYQLGYCDRYLFSRQFKQVMGVSPQGFRRGGGGSPAWELVDSDISGAPPVRAAIDYAVTKLKRARLASERVDKP